MDPVKAMCEAYLGLCDIEMYPDHSYDITLPILDRFNDWISIKVNVSNTICRLSDNGYITSDLDLAGIAYSPNANSKFSSMIDTIISNLMCSYDQMTNEIYMECNKEDLGESMIYFMQCISHVDFLAYNTQGFISSNHIRFKFIVSNYFKQEVCTGFIENPAFKGRRGITHKFGFWMPSGRLVDTLPENNTDLKCALMYKWDDAREGNLKTDYPFYIIENFSRTGKSRERHKAIDEAMLDNDIVSIPWEDKSLVHRYLLDA